MAKNKKNEETQGDAIIIETLDSLDKELEELSKRKKKLEKKIADIRKDMVNTQNQESKLRNEISALVAQEGTINVRREGVEDRLTKLKAKMAEVAKIKDELRKLG
ncbi:MAG: hypothetical protein ABIC04_03585 [Nanoarchaeota archaeon]